MQPDESAKEQAGDPQQDPNAGQADPLKAVQQVGAAINALIQGLQQSGVPKPILDAFQESLAKFQDGVGMLTGNGQPQSQPVSQAGMSEMAGGNPNARPVGPSA